MSILHIILQLPEASHRELARASQESGWIIIINNYLRQYNIIGAIVNDVVSYIIQILFICSKHWSSSNFLNFLVLLDVLCICMCHPYLLQILSKYNRIDSKLLLLINISSVLLISHVWINYYQGTIRFSALLKMDMVWNPIILLKVTLAQIL